MRTEGLGAGGLRGRGAQGPHLHWYLQINEGLEGVRKPKRLRVNGEDDRVERSFLVAY